MTQTLPVRFCGTGMYVPERIVNNQHFIDYLDTTDEWIVTRTGIRERRYAAPDECTSTMGAEASRKAIEDAGISVKDIDVIICATATGDHPFPATATYIQALLGIENIPAFDISAACAGFIHGCVVGAGLIQTGLYGRALIIGAETLARYGNPEDRGTAILFGDAAGAAVMEKSTDPEQQILYTNLGCDGAKADYIICPAGGARIRPSQTTVAEGMHYLHMKGREVFKFAVNKIRDEIDHALEATGLVPDDLKLIIPHQSNLRIIESARERLGLPREKFAINIEKYANTSAASVPTALDTARRDGTLQKGDLVLMIGIGAGLVWGTMIVRL